MAEPSLEEIHKLCGWHRDAIVASPSVGCFYCLAIYSPSEIEDWVDEPEDCPRGPGKTALCPKCGIDAVLPESPDYEL